MVEDGTYQFRVREKQTGAGVWKKYSFPKIGPIPKEVKGIMRNLAGNQELDTHKELLEPSYHMIEDLWNSVGRDGQIRMSNLSVEKLPAEEAIKYKIVIEVGDKNYLPEEISSFQKDILNKFGDTMSALELKRDSDYSGGTIFDVNVTYGVIA